MAYKPDPVSTSSSPDPAPKAEAPKASSKYAKGSESGDPSVHQLLAQRDILQTNRVAVAAEGETQDKQLKEIDRQLDGVTKQLNDLGYE